MKFNNSTWTAIAILIIIILFAIYLKKSSNPQETITIGALFPLTGGLSQYGEVAQKSAQIAMDEINSNGGINGKRLIIDFQDHQCDPPTAVSLFEQMTTVKNIRIFTSAACSGTVLSIAPLLKDKQALLFGTIVTTPKISGVSPYVFRNWASDDSEAKLFSEEIKTRNYKKIGVIYEETDYAKGLKISLEKYLKETNISIVSESYNSESTDMRTQLTKLKRENVDMLFISPQTVTSGDKVLKQMSEINFRPKQLFVNDNIVKSINLLKSYTNILEGGISSDYVITKSQGYDEFLKKYKDKYGVDCPQGNVGSAVYDAINLLAKAIKENGYDAEKIKVYLNNVKYEGISGTISFDDNNDRIGSEYTLYIIKNGTAERYEN